MILEVLYMLWFLPNVDKDYENITEITMKL